MSASALVVAVVAVSLLWHHPATHGWADACCAYSPARLAQGHVWTLPGSALLLPRIQMIGPTTVLFAALFVPYALVAGGPSAIRIYFGGHIVATLVVAAVILPAAALGWPAAIILRNARDVGASAGLAAVAGAFGLAPGRRRAGAVVLAAVLLWYGSNLVRDWHLADVEHLIALVAGAATKLRRRPAKGDGVSDGL